MTQVYFPIYLHQQEAHSKIWHSVVRKSPSLGLAQLHRKFSCHPWCHHLMGVLVQAAALPVQLPANTLGKAVDDGLRTWSPDIHVAELDRVPQSWLQTQATNWGVNQPLKDPSPLSVILSIGWIFKYIPSYWYVVPTFPFPLFFLFFVLLCFCISTFLFLKPSGYKQRKTSDRQSLWKALASTYK